MRITRLIIALSVCVATQADAQTINEIRINAPTADDEEYIELKGNPGQMLSGVHLVVLGDDSSGGDAASGVIEELIDLDGVTFDANGFFTIAEEPIGTDTCATAENLTLCQPLNFENRDNVTFLLVTGLVKNLGDDVDTDDDGVIDDLPEEPWASVIDKIAVLEVENPPTPGEEFHYGPPTVGPEEVPPGSETFLAPGHVYLCAGDEPSWQIGAFEFDTGDDTPGAENPACPNMGGMDAGPMADAGPGAPDAGVPMPMPDAGTGFPPIPETPLTAVDQPGILCNVSEGHPQGWWPLLAVIGLVGARRRRRRS